MSARASKLSLPKVVRGVVRLYREQWRLLLAAGVLVLVPLGLVEALDAKLQGLDLDQVDDLTAITVLGVALGHAGAALLGEVFYSGVVAAGVWEALGGKHHTLRDIARTIPWGRLIVVDLLFALITLGGLLLLVIPGVVFFVWFAISGPIVKIERRAPFDALRRSRELVRGSFWRVLSIVIPLELLTDAAINAAANAGHSIGGESLMGEWAGAALGELIATPLYAAVLVVVAFQLIALERGEVNPS